MDVILLYLIKNLFFKKKIDELIHIKKFSLLFFFLVGQPANPHKSGAD